MLQVLKRGIIASKSVSLQNGLLTLPLRSKTIIFDCSPELTLKSLRDECAAQGFSNVQFLLEDGTAISSSTYFKELHESYLIKIDDTTIKVQGVKEERTDRWIDDLLQEVRMDEIKRHDLISYLSRVSNAISLEKEVSQERFFELLKGMLPHSEKSGESIKDEIVKLEKYQKELDKYAVLEANASRKAQKYANRVFLGGLGILSLQMSYIGLGTFVFYSWDVMEPQAYLITLGNFIYGMGYYNIKKKEFTMESLYESLISSRKAKLLKKEGVDLERLEYLKSEIERLKKVLARIN